MKLKHHITSLILTIAIATSTALSAAGIPNVKAPPSIKTPVAAPKIPTVKIPTAPKVPTAPRVPVVKVPSLPKIPNVPKVVKVPSAPKIPVTPKVPVVRVPVTPKIAKTPVAPKIPTVKIVSAPKVRVTSQVPSVTNRVPSAPKPAVNSARLANLKQKLPVEVQSGITSGKGARFVSDHFAGAGTNKPGTIMDSIKQGTGTKDRNPLSAGGPLNNMRGDKTSQASDTGLPAWMGSKRRNAAEDADGGSKTTVSHGKDGSITVVKNDTTTTLKADGTVIETDKNGKTTKYDPAGEPLPDDVKSGGTPVVTKDTIKGIKARKGGAGEPEEESAGSTGPVNTGAQGTGKFGSLSQPTAESAAGTRVTTFDAKGIQTRIESRINTGNR